MLFLFLKSNEWKSRKVFSKPSSVVAEMLVVVEKKVVVKKEALAVAAEAEVVVVFVLEKRWGLDRPLSTCHFCTLDLPPHARLFFSHAQSKIIHIFIYCSFLRTKGVFQTL